MYNGGLIGNLGIVQALGQMVTMQANEYLPKGQKPYQVKDFMPSTHDFLSPPKSQEEMEKDLNLGLSMLGSVPPQSMLEMIKQAEARRGS